jgi:hypothetical protein
MITIESILACISVLLIWSSMFGNYDGYQSGYLGDCSLPVRLFKFLLAVLIWLIYFTIMYFVNKPS